MSFIFKLVDFCFSFEFGLCLGSGFGKVRGFGDRDINSYLCSEFLFSIYRGFRRFWGVREVWKFGGFLGGIMF